MITMSALPRLLGCTGSSALPHAQVANVWADLGNEEHENLSDLAELPEELARLVPGGARSEVKIAYDVATRTGRIIGEGSGRGYGALGPFEIPGSVDVLGVEGDAVVIVDWKTGFNLVEAAATNPQLWGYGLAAARALGKSSAIMRISYTKLGKVDAYEADALELAAFADRLERLQLEVARLQAARGVTPSTNEGPWCRYCPSKAFCPSKNALLVQVAAGGLATIGDTEMNPMRAAAGYRELVRIEALTKEARGRLTAYVEANGPIDLGEGRLYGRHTRRGKAKLDPAIARQAIREIVGESAKEFETVAFEMSTSQAAIERAARLVRAKGFTKLKTDVVDRIEQLGGLKRETEYPVGEFFADKNAPAPAGLDLAELDALFGAAGATT